MLIRKKFNGFDQGGDGVLRYQGLLRDWYQGLLGWSTISYWVAYNNSYDFSIQISPYASLYGIESLSPFGWFEVGEARFIGPELVLQSMKKMKVIQERLETTQSRQKSYIDVSRMELEFEVDDWFTWKFSPMKGVMRGKLVLSILVLTEYPRGLAM